MACSKTTSSRSAPSSTAAQDVAIINARIVVGNGTVIERGTVVVRGRVSNLQVADQITQLRKAMMGVVSEGGTAAGAAIRGVSVAGKTGTAQTLRYSSGGKPLYYAWFAGMAPAEAPQVVVVVMVPDVTFEGATSAGLATKIIQHYLHVQVNNKIENTG